VHTAADLAVVHAGMGDARSRPIYRGWDVLRNSSKQPGNRPALVMLNILRTFRLQSTSRATGRFAARHD
jgi:hypothetical protein